MYLSPRGRERMGLSDSRRDRGLGPLVRTAAVSRSRVAGFLVFSLLVLGGLGLSPAGASRGAAPPLEISAPPITAGDDIGVGVTSLPDYFVSPITGSSYLILKDATRGTYSYCSLT